MVCGVTLSAILVRFHCLLPGIARPAPDQSVVFGPVLELYKTPERYRQQVYRNTAQVSKPIISTRLCRIDFEV